MVAAWVAAVALAGACGSGPSPAPSGESSPRPTSRATLRPGRSPSPGVPAGFCGLLGDVRIELTELLAVPRRVANRRVLDEALTELDAAFDNFRQAERGSEDDALERPMRQAGYQMVDVILSIEDYRTTTRPAEAADHIERAGTAFMTALEEVAVLARCRP